jgi:hypothetical protein
MKVKRLVVSLLVALMAPWGAIVLADAPHRMACCPSGRTEPMVRPCCAMEAQPGTVTIPAATPGIAPLQALGPLGAPVETGRLRGDVVRAAAKHPIALRLLTSVSQI